MVLLPGCAPLITGSALDELVAALAKDNASACARAKVDPGVLTVGPQVTLEICRTNSKDATVLGMKNGEMQVHHNVGFRPETQPRSSLRVGP